MSKMQINNIDNSDYVAIITVLDYEILLSEYLKKIVFECSVIGNKKILVDLALKCGINQYRFVEFGIDNNGKINLDTNNFVKLSDTLELYANNLLKSQSEIVLNSILTETKKREILDL